MTHLLVLALVSVLWAFGSIAPYFSLRVLVLSLGGGILALVYRPALRERTLQILTPLSSRSGSESSRPVSVLIQAGSSQEKALSIPGRINGPRRKHAGRLFVDGGAEATLVGESWVETALTKPSASTLSGLGGGSIPVLGETLLKVSLSGTDCSIPAFVVNDADIPLNCASLLGGDFLEKYQVTIAYKANGVKEFSFNNKTIRALRLPPKDQDRLVKTDTTTGSVPEKYLQKFSTLFSEPTELPPSRKGIDLSIKISSPPPASREITAKGENMAFIHDECKRLLNLGFIRPVFTNPAVNPCSAFVVTDPASECRGEAKKRIVYDYVKLNAVTDLLPSHLPRIHDLLQQAGTSTYFSKMDVRAGFHNLRVEESSIPLTVFSFPTIGFFEWLVMPFGLAGAPGAMQGLMRYVLGELIWEKGVIVYLDDILVHAETQEEHDRLLEKVLQRLQDKGLHLKAAKCAVRVRNVDFLGYRLENGFILPMKSKVQGILDFPLPSSVQAWQRFHGMINFYRKHVPRFAEILKPISSVLGLKQREVDQSFEFEDGKRAILAKAIRDKDPILATSFEAAKASIANPAVLTPIDPAKTLYLFTDASLVGWGSVLTHDETGKTEPCAWFSGTFKENELGWHSIHREIYALIATLRGYPEYFSLSHHPVVVLTDSKHLAEWSQLDISSARLSGWNETLVSFNLRLRHIPGTTNIVADALSRPVDDNNCKWKGKVFPNQMIAYAKNEISFEATSVAHTPKILLVKAAYKSSESQELLRDNAYLLTNSFHQQQFSGTTDPVIRAPANSYHARDRVTRIPTPPLVEIRDPTGSAAAEQFRSRLDNSIIGDNRKRKACDPCPLGQCTCIPMRACGMPQPIPCVGVCTCIQFRSCSAPKKAKHG